MRPSSTLAVDANIIVSVVLGFKTRALWPGIVGRRRLVVSEDDAAEALTVADRQRARLGTARSDVAELMTMIEVVPSDRYEFRLVAAQTTLRNAVASRKGSVNDAHVLALAWTYDADIWSHDRDFAGTGWPSWSSANLAAALSEEAAAPAVER